MTHRQITAIALAAGSILVAGITLAAQDRDAVTSPNGIALSEFKGYEAWQVIAPSLPADGIKVILGNPTMIRALSDGIPANGTPVPDGAAMAKIEWSTRDNPLRGAAMVPDVLRNQ